ncbi:DASH family cryptochrome [Vibrio taketomensis]|uniref:DASH family cryptochrome n=1 Tax=Vibrio taketomensis TaxID=2572923 RepID=UPI001389B311|nr:DASH family cryptochrome [Vibrio taketomensis]
MSSEIIGIYWFSNDLRVTDNALLARAAQDVDKLICLCCRPSISRYLQHFSQQSNYGAARVHFENQCLSGLNDSLAELGQSLVIVEEQPLGVLSQLIEQFGVSALYCEQFVGFDERRVVKQLQSNFSQLQVHQAPIRTLFAENELPFEVESLPASFSKFRRLVETTPISPPCPSVLSLPPSPWLRHPSSSIPSSVVSTRDTFIGGEAFAMAHCMCYFSTSFPSHYKQTRNQLDGFEASTKFSPWLAKGCISPRQLVDLLRQYEERNGANDSTYWIYFELLWREYFQWYALKYGKQLFALEGITQLKPLTTFYAQRFKQWCQGTTRFPIVNACMRQLNQTGYMSNRGRQLAASCLIYELGIDWRYGAAYFETQLIDFDVASNWGNWQYIAGVGASNKERHFNLAKQTQYYDPHGDFIRQWKGDECCSATDSVNIDDWPFSA